MKEKCVVRCAFGRRSFGDVAVGAKRLEVTMPSVSCLLTVFSSTAAATGTDLDKPNDVYTRNNKPWTSPARGMQGLLRGRLLAVGIPL